jgi:hypothetical protein
MLLTRDGGRELWSIRGVICAIGLCITRACRAIYDDTGMLGGACHPSSSKIMPSKR